MALKLDYEWRLRPLLAERGIYNAVQLRPRLEEHGLRLSDSQVWRLLTGKPERLNLKLLMVLCELLGCTPNDLIRPIEEAIPSQAERISATAAGLSPSLVPKRAQIRTTQHDRRRD